jgi:hypothetical protein
MTDTTVWRTHHGAEYASIQCIPCNVIANGDLIGPDGDTIGDDYPELMTEIKRRGMDIYLDHGYGEGHGGVQVAGCDHTATGSEAADWLDDLAARIPDGVQVTLNDQFFRATSGEDTQ